MEPLITLSTADEVSLSPSVCLGDLETISGSARDTLSFYKVLNTTLYNLSTVGSSVTPALRRPKQEDYKLQVSLGYISACLKASRKGTAIPCGANTVSTEQSRPFVIFFIATT